MWLVVAFACLFKMINRDNQVYLCLRYKTLSLVEAQLVVHWLAHWTSDLEAGGSSLVSVVVLFL